MPLRRQHEFYPQPSDEKSRLTRLLLSLEEDSGEGVLPVSERPPHIQEQIAFFTGSRSIEATTEVTPIE
jgi:hypothetical protein